MSECNHEVRGKCVGLDSNWECCHEDGPCTECICKTAVAARADLERRLAESEAGAAAKDEALTDALPGIVEAIRMEFGLSQIKGKGLIRQIDKALSYSAGKSFLAEREVLLKVGNEIQSIMETYREQDARPEGVGTPGGLEHMGDVWRLFRKWDEALAKLRSPNPGQDAEEKP